LTNEPNSAYNKNHLKSVDQEIVVVIPHLQ